MAWQGPGLVLGPIAGALADRVDRRRILVVAQVLSVLPAAALGIFTVAGWITPWQVIVFAFVTGVVRSFEIPTRQAFIPDIVAAEDLADAIGMNSALFNGARLIGPAIAGALIPFVGEGWCFIANAVSYLAILAALLAMTLPRPAARRAVTSSMLADILEGLAHVRREPALKALLGGLGFFAVVGMPYSVLLPSFASRQLDGGPHTFSWLQAAVGFGAMVRRLRHRGALAGRRTRALAGGRGRGVRGAAGRSVARHLAADRAGDAGAARRLLHRADGDHQHPVADARARTSARPGDVAAHHALPRRLSALRAGLGLAGRSSERGDGARRRRRAGGGRDA